MIHFWNPWDQTYLLRPLKGTINLIWMTSTPKYMEKYYPLNNNKNVFCGGKCYMNQLCIVNYVELYIFLHPNWST